jgi:hypothetical protein
MTFQTTQQGSLVFTKIHINTITFYSSHSLSWCASRIYGYCELIIALLLLLGTSFHYLPQIHRKLQKNIRSLLKHEAINNNNDNGTDHTKIKILHIVIYLI